MRGDDMRVTIACPEEMISDANQLALCLGYGPDDVMTYGLPIWRDNAGNRYAVASGLVSEAFAIAARSPLAQPEWGADMVAAARAQSAITIGIPASPTCISAVFGEASPSLAALGIYRVDGE